MKTKLPKLVKRIYWCGFFNNRPHVSSLAIGEKQVILHMTKKEAKKYYSDVRKVILLEAP